MMIVAFFTPNHGHAGCSTNLLATAAYLSLHHQKNVLMIDVHYEANLLEQMLIGKSKQSDHLFPSDFGLDSIARSHILSPITLEELKNKSYSFLGGKLHYLPKSRQANSQIFLKTIAPSVFDVIKAADAFDFIMLDLSSEETDLTKELLELADISLINLSQNPMLLQNYFTNDFAKAVSKKSELLYLLGNYEKDTRFNIRNLSHLFPSLLYKKTFGIAYNPALREASYEANLLTYIRKKEKKRLRGFEKDYFSGLERIAKYLLRKAGEAPSRNG